LHNKVQHERPHEQRRSGAAGAFQSGNAIDCGGKFINIKEKCATGKGSGLGVEFGDEDELWSDAEETRRA
jgi:hypothetical protein